MKEIYKSITGYKNYEVSNLGKVKNVKTGRILKPSLVAGYYAVNLYFNGKPKIFSIHKLVAFAFLKTIEGKSFVDHRDNNRQNNNIRNLRFCSTSQNNMNRTKQQSKTATSKFKGVCFAKKYNKWRAQIQSNKKAVHIGYFKTEIEAAKAYDVKAKELFGEFAKLNFENEDD